MAKVVALLPMKANSSRVPGKNFRDFCGKPLFRWMLDKLLEVPDIDTIIINTDARELLESHGLVETDRVLIRDRAEELCGDDVSMNLIIQDDIENVKSDIYLMTHTTNPLLTTETMSEALKKFMSEVVNGEADSLFTVNKVQSRFYDSKAVPINHNPADLIPTQNLEPWYEENSNLYIFTADSFGKTKARIGKNPIMYETKPKESIDIDTPEDWELGVITSRYLLEVG